jgi:hypothetical protein
MKNALVFINFQQRDFYLDEESAFRTRAFTSQSATTGPCPLLEIAGTSGRDRIRGTRSRGDLREARASSLTKRLLGLLL